MNFKNFLMQPIEVGTKTKTVVKTIVIGVAVLIVPTLVTIKTGLEDINKRLEQDIIRLERITEFSKNLTILGQIINTMEVEVGEKDNQIAELQKEREELEQEVEELKKQLAAKEASAATAATVEINSSTTTSTGEWVTATATAYCSCSICCGSYSTGYTASGSKATAGRTIAASSAYAFGTQIEIEGMGVYVVEDRGGAITGNKIDIYFDSHQEALNFGRKTIKIREVN